jgi:hypothetical protein
MRAAKRDARGVVTVMLMRYAHAAKNGADRAANLMSMLLFLTRYAQRAPPNMSPRVPSVHATMPSSAATQTLMPR